jgi:uncharacterized phage protein (TIGR02218 family)
VKTLPGNIATAIAQGTSTLAYGLRVVRTDGAIFAFTSAMDDALIGGDLYKSSTGLDVSDIEISSGFAVSNLELTTLDDGSTFTHIDVYSGKWKNAAFTLLRYDFTNPTAGQETLLAGTVGDVSVGNGRVTAEFRGLQQYLQQPVGMVTSKTCRARLGDSACTVALGPYTFTGTITSVTSQQVFADSARAQAADYFAEGILTFTSGECAGLSQKVKAHAGGGVFTLSLPMTPAVSVGDAYTITAGCRKRFAEDCIGKFNNVLNFQGEPYIPGTDALSQ